MNSFTGGGGMFLVWRVQFSLSFFFGRKCCWFHPKKHPEKLRRSPDFLKRFFSLGLGALKGGRTSRKFLEMNQDEDVVALECSTRPSGPFLEEHPEYWIDRCGLDHIMMGVG